MTPFRRLAFFTLCVSVATVSIRADAQSSADTLYKRNKGYAQQTGLYALYRTSSADVVMLGNSITFGANWNELMGRERIVNRGIGGDLTQGFLRRLGYVYRLNPKLCCIMGGINDLYEDIPVETVFANYRMIIDTLRAHKIIPIIQSTLYVSPKWKRAAEKNEEVKKLDALLEDFAEKENIDFVNLNTQLSDGTELRDEVTTDGVHLTPLGYRLWRDELEKVLRKYGL